MSNEIERFFMPDYKKLHDSFIEIVAMRFHAIAKASGPNSWGERYPGTQKDDLLSCMGEGNRFRREVESIASELMHAAMNEHNERIAGLGDSGCLKITMIGIDEWWQQNLERHRNSGRADAERGVFAAPNHLSDDPQYLDENQAYKEGFMERRKELGDKFKWA